MVTLTTWLSASIVVLTAALVQAVTGFGFALIAIPFLLLIFKSKIAIGMSMIISFASLFLLFLKVRKNVEWKIVKNLIFGAVTGLPVGIYIFLNFKVSALKIMVNLLVIILCFLMFFKIKYKARFSSKLQLGVGGLSGALTGSIGVPGPPVILFLNSIDLPKERFRATTIAYFVLVYPLTYISLSLFGAFTFDTLKTALTLIPFTYIGIFIGNKIFIRISSKMFKKITLFILLVAAIYSIAREIVIAYCTF